jgi:hypothetical protein
MAAVAPAFPSVGHPSGCLHSLALKIETPDDASGPDEDGSDAKQRSDGANNEC